MDVYTIDIPADLYQRLAAIAVAHGGENLTDVIDRIVSERHDAEPAWGRPYPDRDETPVVELEAYAPTAPPAADNRYAALLDAPAYVPEPARPTVTERWADAGAYRPGSSAYTGPAAEPAPAIELDAVPADLRVEPSAWSAYIAEFQADGEVRGGGRHA